MGETTAISWTDATWNPWRGCHRVSPGCLNCYMYAGMRRFGNDPKSVVRAADVTFNAPHNWYNKRIFVCSWSDFFIEEADAWRVEVWEMIAFSYWAAQGNVFQLLTKRPERIAECLPADWNAQHSLRECDNTCKVYPCRHWPNVWLGVTAENQEMADRRIPILREIPAALRFVSVEPMLEPVRLDLMGIDWVICGGESGPKRRPFDLAWARDLRDQCQEAGVPFFYKQGSGLRPGEDHLLDGQVIQECPPMGTAANTVATEGE